MEGGALSGVSMQTIIQLLGVQQCTHSGDGPHRGLGSLEAQRAAKYLLPGVL